MNFQGNFILIDASPTHNQVLFRASSNSPDERSNIDILFYGVGRMDISFVLDNPIILRRRLDSLIHGQHGSFYLFEIRTAEALFSITAGGAKYQRNSFDSKRGLAIKHEEPLTPEKIAELTANIDWIEWLKTNQQKEWTEIE